MKRRRLSWMPTWLLEWILERPTLRPIWRDAFFELWARATEDEIAAAANEEDGPWPCAMPRGCH